MADIEDVLKVVEHAEPRTDSVAVPLDSAVLARLEELERVVRAARRTAGEGSITDDSPLLGLEEELAVARAEAEKAATTFTFRELKRPEYAALERACPPTQPGKSWDEDKFGPALLAASCIDPQMTSEQAIRLWGNLGVAASSVLFVTAYSLQRDVGRVPFGVSTTGSTPSSELNSTIADPEESPTPTS